MMQCLDMIDSCVLDDKTKRTEGAAGQPAENKKLGWNETEIEKQVSKQNENERILIWKIK